VPAGGMLLPPSENGDVPDSLHAARLTKPIVEKTLEPILNRLGRDCELASRFSI
jgi:hypothetical protein